MATKNIYAVDVTKFNAEGEIEMRYIQIALYTTIKKAYEEIRYIARVHEDAHIKDDNTPEMTVYYTDKDGCRVIQGIHQYLLQ